MTIDTSGNVGIGTTTTGSKLHVLLNGNTSGGPTGNVASFQNSSAGNNAYISLFGAYNAEAGIIFTDESEQYKGKIGYDNISEYMYFQTDGSEKARITSTGNVGIGVTNPSYKLDVNGSFNFVTSGVYLTYNSGVLYHGNYYQFPSGSYYYLYGRTGMGLIFGSNNAEVGRFDLFGNLGIGTTSPNEKLHVAGNVHAYAAGGIDSGLFASTSAGSTSIAIRSNGVTHFNGGNVGIGTNSPNTKLTILGGDDASGTGVLELATGGGTNLKLGGNSAYSWIQSHSSKPLRINELGNSVIFNLGGGAVGIGTSSPATLLDVNGVITATGGNSTNWNTAYSWGNHSSAGYVPQARTLTINGTTYDLSANRSWTIATTTPGGSNTQFQYNSSGTLAGASALTYDSGTNRVGINQASPGYDLDVNGQVRVQDKLRVGTVNSGNGVVHMSSTATINPSATTIVWSQNVSVGMCAFIEYYILNNNTTTDQRAGTIMVTWNQSGTPTIAHTETTTPDIGSTIAVNFTSSLVGSDARINAVNSSSAPYTIVMSYKYF
jgi:YD repeat-containing protein